MEKKIVFVFTLTAFYFPSPPCFSVFTVSPLQSFAFLFSFSSFHHLCSLLPPHTPPPCLSSVRTTFKVLLVFLHGGLSTWQWHSALLYPDVGRVLPEHFGRVCRWEACREKTHTSTLREETSRPPVRKLESGVCEMRAECVSVSVHAPLWECVLAFKKKEIWKTFNYFKHTVFKCITLIWYSNTYSK